MDRAAVDAALERGHAVQRRWRRESHAHRADVAVRLAAELRRDREGLAATITAEMGKPLAEARAEVEKSAWVLEHYAEHGAGYLAEDPIDAGRGRTAWVQHPPLGVVLAIMPWNYPVWQVVRAAAPVLVAGGSVVVKHAPNVTGVARRLHGLFAEVAPSLLEVIVVDVECVATAIADPRIAAVTFTGSDRAGRAVAGACAQALKPSVLELGGSDAFVVLGDADVARAATAAAASRFGNAGQSCVAAKRFVVEDAVADEFTEALVAAAEALVVGRPTGEVDMGPLARRDLRDALAEQVVRGVAAGGRLLLGGQVEDGPGAYYPATVVADVELGSPLATEETFGPVAAILRVPDADAAIDVANASPYGLSSSLWTADPERARRLASRIEAGAIFVNAPTVSDPRVPFGGIKRSGWGRELGALGIREFVNAQSVVMAAGSAEASHGG